MHISDSSRNAIKLFSDTGDASTYGIYSALLTICLKQRKKAIFFSLQATTLIMVMNITKMLYKENRPSWEADRLTI